MHSIRFKITAITIAAILTTIVAVFAGCYSTIQVENDRRSVEILNLIKRDAQKSLEKYFESIEQSVETVANLASDSLDSITLVENGAVGTYVKAEERTAQQTRHLDSYLADYCAGLQEVFESTASHTQGVVTYYYCINPEVSETEHGFFYSKVGKTGFAEREPLDARTLDPEDLEHTTWYYTPIQRGRPSWVGPYTAHFLGEMWICSYLIPIYNAGSLIGVMGMDISVETLSDQISPIRVYNSGYACLLDDEGRVIYHPDMETGSIPDQLGPSFVEEFLLEGDSGEELIRYTVDGENRQLSFSTLSNGMKLVVTAPTKEINASWTQLVQVIILITAAVIIVFVVLVMLAMGIITRPLLRLTDASKRLAAADYDVELSYSGKDEVGVLTQSFMYMRDQLKRLIEDLNRRVYTDSLTGLPNMRHFFKLAEKERSRLFAEGKIPMVLYFNLIGMKHYNQQYGFEEGDRLICGIGEILERHYGRDCLCRYSEDHFAAITQEVHLEEELQAVFQDCLHANGSTTLPVRVGIYPSDLDQVRISVACDRAKFACDKLRGSFISGFRYFDKTMLRQLENVRYIINHLDRALKEGWIQVYYQPIVRTVSGKVCDLEALSRWIDPEIGLLPPSDFIPILEEAHLIYKLDLYVLDQLLKKLQKYYDTGLKAVPHSLNLSRADFDSIDIVEEIRRRVDAAGIPRDRLTIEITESMVGSDFEFMKEQIHRFQELGFQVWMDDFGSGYSSLDVLQEIHFDLLKFDMRFMQHFERGSESRIIVSELVRMAAGLGIDTLCEGVETKEQFEFLREVGCSKQQGYYFSKALPYEEILDRYEQDLFTVS